MVKGRGTRAGWTRREVLKGVAAAGGGAWPLGRAPAVLAASSGPVKLGVLLPYSKVYAVLGEHITNAMELYFESVGWTAGGRKIEWIKEDEELEPAVALRKARKLIESDQVDILTGVVSTATSRRRPETGLIPRPPRSPAPGASPDPPSLSPPVRDNPNPAPPGRQGS